MESENLLEGKRILAVDDEPDVLETIEELLTMCEVTKATNFSQAKELMETQEFDMAILDIMGVDGYKLLELANEKKVTAVMLTAHALSTENIVKSFKEGAASYIPKDELANIGTFLCDILEAKEKGRDVWWRFSDRLGVYFDKKFGTEWRDKLKDVWGKLYYI
jgi:DNA-binding NtrC family response regulator